MGEEFNNLLSLKRGCSTPERPSKIQAENRRNPATARHTMRREFGQERCYWATECRPASTHVRGRERRREVPPSTTKIRPARAGAQGREGIQREKRRRIGTPLLPEVWFAELPGKVGLKKPQIASDLLGGLESVCRRGAGRCSSLVGWLEGFAGEELVEDCPGPVTVLQMRTFWAESS